MRIIEPAAQQSDLEPPQSTTLGRPSLNTQYSAKICCYTAVAQRTTAIHPIARKLLISCPAEGRRLSWPEHTVDWLGKVRLG